MIDEASCITRAAEINRLHGVAEMSHDPRQIGDIVRVLMELHAMSDAEYAGKREAFCMAQDRAEHRRSQRDGNGPGAMIRNAYRGN